MGWFNKNSQDQADRQHTQNTGEVDRNGWPMPYGRDREAYENRTGLCYCCGKSLDQCRCNVPGCGR